MKQDMKDNVSKVELVRHFISLSQIILSLRD